MGNKNSKLYLEMIEDYKFQKIKEPYLSKIKFMSGIGMSIVVILAFSVPNSTLKEFVIALLSFFFLLIESLYESAVSRDIKNLKSKVTLYSLLILFTSVPIFRIVNNNSKSVIANINSNVIISIAAGFVIALLLGSLVSAFLAILTIRKLK